MTRTTYLLTLAGLTGALLLTGCADDSTVTPSPAVTAPAAIKGVTPAVERDIATLRAATARFRRFDVAQSAQYTFLFMNMCMVDDGPNSLGGMGYHYVNTQLLDGHVDVETPEALLYERKPNGEMSLVAVEYVIPQAAWQGPGKPTLFGRDFTLNKFGLWALHVWAWKENPSGVFADWNPRVSCDNAAAAAGR